MAAPTETPKRQRKPEPAGVVSARGASLKERRKEQGLKRVEVWVRPEDEERIRSLARELTQSPQ
jgi:hypothetical protein